jgi:capsular polysaccharide export protein
MRFRTKALDIKAGDTVAVWRSRVSSAVLNSLEKCKARLAEVEDGFIRSAGLGVHCVPPLSIVVDRLGAHFDPQQPSELEFMLQEEDFSTELVDRARRLRELIVASGVSKYGVARSATHRRVGGRKHVLVPGQVEDDRSVLMGGGEVKTNLELLRRARAAEPGAYIIYKPHPDVEAAHRCGSIPDPIALELADEVERVASMPSLIAMVDELHVNTSLAGFEALLREKAVTTHGVPFYAGWGLTRDLGVVPARRTRRRTVDELVTAVLLIYPRYLDPETKLPCPAEVLIRRLSQQTSFAGTGAVVRLRRLQGTLKRHLAAVMRR